MLSVSMFPRHRLLCYVCGGVRTILKGMVGCPLAWANMKLANFSFTNCTCFPGWLESALVILAAQLLSHNTLPMFMHVSANWRDRTR